MNAVCVLILKIIRAEARRLAKKAAENEPDAGAWLGRASLERISAKPRLFLYGPELNDPLRFRHNSGAEFMAGPIKTDLGSIPWLFQKIPPGIARLKPADFWEAYCGHDFACEKGYVYTRMAPGMPWEKLAVSKVQADVLLHWFLSATTLDGKSATRGEVFAIYRSVRAFHSALRK